MPLYEYLCVRCKHRFERIDKFTARKTRKCPKCGDKAQRQLAAPAIQFKGAGWYVTDYGGKNRGESKAEKQDTAEKADKAASAKKDTTPVKTERPAAKGKDK